MPRRSCTLFSRLWMGACLLAAAAMPVQAGQVEEAEYWLNHMQQAAEKLNYDGVFVYRRADQMDSLRVIHRAEPAPVRERLLSLSGAAREVIRDDHEVRCILPDERAVVIEQRKAGDTQFPALLPRETALLRRHYDLRLGGEVRVAGRVAQEISIMPRDDYRYGYSLWADQETGLMLRADITDRAGRVTEQFLFNQIRIGVDILDTDLAAQTRTEGFAMLRRSGRPTANSTAAMDKTWRVRALPAGYVLRSRMTRFAPTGRTPVQHLIFSDGLSVVSVFVERTEPGVSAPPVQGLHRIGAMHSFGRNLQGYLVTVVGDVPEPTVRMIGNSVEPGAH